MKQRRNNYKINLLIFLAIAVGVAIFYGNTLKNGFVHDDHGVIETNTYIHSLRYLPKVITGCVWESANGSCKNTLNYHPIPTLSYLLTYQISPKPWIFHLVNLIYFSVSVFMVFLLVKLLTKNFLIALLSALIFLIHPINSEVGNWVSTAPDTLYTIFAALATIYYFPYRENEKSRHLIFVYIFYALGVMTKEPAVFIPLIFLALDLIYFKQKISSFFRWKNLNPYLILAAILGVYMALRFLVLGSFVADSVNSVNQKLSIIQYVYTFFYLFVQYLQKLFWPYPLNYFHLFNPSYRLLSVDFALTVFFVIIYLGLLLLALKKHWKVVQFALIWFLVFLFPNLAFVNSVGDNKLAERHIFASVISFSLLIAIILEWFWRKWEKGKIAVIGILGAVSILSFFYISSRNPEWRNDVAIDVATLKYSSDADLIRYNLSLAYRSQNNLKLAKRELEIIIKRNVWRDLYQAYYGMGDIYRREGNFKEALKNFQAALKLNPLHKEAYNNLGAMSVEKGYLLESLPYLCKAIQIDPNFKNANSNFDYAASRIQGLDNRSFMALYDKILKGDIFKPSESKDLITPKARDCSLQQGCLLTFDSQLPKNEFMFPFMIVGKTPYNEIVRIRYSAFDPQTNQITLGIDHKFGNSPIHLYFPACGGIYYETDTK